MGECKWTERRVGANVLEDLKRSASVLLHSYPARRVHYALFARSGFTPDLHQVAQSEPVSLFTLEDLTSP